MMNLVTFLSCLLWILGGMKIVFLCVSLTLIKSERWLENFCKVAAFSFCPSKGKVGLHVIIWLFCLFSSMLLFELEICLLFSEIFSFFDSFFNMFYCAMMLGCESLIGLWNINCQHFDWMCVTDIFHQQWQIHDHVLWLQKMLKNVAKSFHSYLSLCHVTLICYMMLIIYFIFIYLIYLHIFLTVKASYPFPSMPQRR